VSIASPVAVPLEPLEPLELLEPLEPLEPLDDLAAAAEVVVFVAVAAVAEGTTAWGWKPRTPAVPTIVAPRTMGDLRIRR
jgi:hypothetical protein